MARIQNQRASQRNDVRDGSRAALRKKKNKDQYKIVLEAVTQEKKKLHSILTYASNAPDGFGFIPAGHPEFTEWCKEQCRQRNLDVHIVSAKPKNKTHTDPAKLSHHVHRVGHHFPMRIVNLACSKFGYDYDIRKGLRKTNDRENWIAQRFEAYSSRQANQGGPTTERETKMYIHDAVREMFPKIPEADLQAIVDHAFEEGTDRVGNAKGLSLARRVQLAVVAHIRHMYTDYDKLLKSDGWQAARAQVEHVSLAKLKEWRDEAGEQSNELEETFREVIVIDDDDDDDDDSLSFTSCSMSIDGREPSMEIISRRMDAQDLHPNLNADYPRVEADQFLRIFSHSHSSHSNLFENHFRLSRVTFLAMTHTTTPPADTWSPQARPTLASAQPMISKIDGQMYQLQPIGQVGGGSRSKYEPPYTAARSAPGYVQPSSSRFSSFDRSSAPARRPSDQDVALPSVERETIDLTSPRRIPAYQQPVQNHEAPTRSYDDVHAYKRKVPSFTVDDERLHPERLIKRPMLVHREEAYTRTHKNGVPEFHPNQQTGYYSAPRGAPPEPVIDLTSSPDGRDRPPPRRSAVPAGLRGYAYHPEVPAGEPSRSYMSDTRLYERRAPPAHDNPFQDGRQPFPAPRDDVRYTRNGSRYGG
ncbi:conserved hypothetical protein [Pyrenophora tritici-repentis Pt-1C-BFP]|uniref:DUF2293 domain-containing protein n=1 Tax=Pyrenophora tritici-repentis (strain Pt-1C-BFP) TaxID=426418 RepID=B2WGE2_PYRTR|nr:uncharacterized protein PTRG_08998 [Pyrenophora tritici-repentis Pt-1C-BFP]EDU42049.1 conserved hypothetical protein [Pyrenophora tritici-repentis Pt-1C-BFP]